MFYRGRDIFELRKGFAGPLDMRPCELTDGHIAIFTRTCGLKSERGTIGYPVADPTAPPKERTVRYNLRGR